MGIYFHDDSNHLVVYPNPANDIVTIKLTNESEIQLLSIEGKVVQSFSNIVNSISIDVKQLENGYYFVRAIDKDGVSITTKFVKQ